MRHMVNGSDTVLFGDWKNPVGWHWKYNWRASGDTQRTAKISGKAGHFEITLSEIKEHIWLTNCGAEPLPSEADQLSVIVTDEEVKRVVTEISKLVSLILVKTMLRQLSLMEAPNRETNVEERPEKF
ncbi:hypothetical protein K0M31_018769 [Melipona bicolor]|uniref:Uncharacterized protein n=1 Tax=Melipona bicolor TaxID=60889 RepID=A0AA40G489_9HYME|nr:hypothetical protein K0M31_018769 [Melipona bicolor]